MARLSVCVHRWIVRACRGRTEMIGTRDRLRYPIRSVGPPISRLPSHDAQCRKEGFEFGKFFLVGDFHRSAHHALQELYLISIEFYKVVFHDVTVPIDFQEDALTSSSLGSTALRK